MQPPKVLVGREFGAISMSIYLAAYDISSNRRRRQAAATLGRYGRRIQRSVFQLSTTKAELIELRRELAIFLSSGDVLEIIPIDQSSDRQRFSWGGYKNEDVVAMF